MCMYEDFDSFFENFKCEVSAMDNDDFLRFLQIPKSILSTGKEPIQHD